MKRRFESSDILNSWKEIAAYLNRGKRTVQRWEVDLGMPVHRPASKSRSAVVAFRSELERWLKTDRTAAYAASSEPGAERRYSLPSASELMKSVERCQSLCTEMQHEPPRLRWGASALFVSTGIA